MSWSHYVELLKMNDFFEINYYCRLSIQENLSVRELRTRIKNKEYERLDEETKEKIKNQSKKQEITDYIKNPIIIQNKNRYEEISEKVLQKIILEDIPSFLEELGDGFTFIKNEYKIKIGNRYNYIDLLLFNIEYNVLCSS
ncbi:MAG: YhcG family protein [Bacilli bacterium]|nr:YhcG family protein [Bacilli bacterium]